MVPCNICITLAPYYCQHHRQWRQTSFCLCCTCYTTFSAPPRNYIHKCATLFCPAPNLFTTCNTAFMPRLAPLIIDNIKIIKISISGTPKSQLLAFFSTLIIKRYNYVAYFCFFTKIIFKSYDPNSSILILPSPYSDNLNLKGTILFFSSLHFVRILGRPKSQH